MQAQIRSEMLRDAKAFACYWDEIQSLRSRLGVESDVLLNPVHFLAATDDTRRSCSVLVWRDKELIGVIYATQHYMKGIATGYGIGGDYTGRGLLLCLAADESLVLREAMRRMTSEGVHSLHLRFLPRDLVPRGEAIAPIRGLKMKWFDAVIPGDVLHLQLDYEEFLSTLGKHTRRNIRAFIRKTEQAGIEFVPSLSKEEYDSAVERLNAATDFPADPLHLSRDERLLALHNGERLGLRSADGTLIAVMCGFRKGGKFHLLTQLNDVHYERFSLSLVLRGYVTRHLIEHGLTCLHFLGGSSLSFGRYCQPENYRSIFVDRQNGLAAAVKMFASGVVRLMQNLERSIPERLAMICNGHLDDALLTERTALRPAAMLQSQRKGVTAEPTAASPLLRARASV
jgi:hypothetical protein